MYLGDTVTILFPLRHVAIQEKVGLLGNFVEGMMMNQGNGNLESMRYMERKNCSYFQKSGK